MAKRRALLMGWIVLGLFVVSVMMIALVTAVFFGSRFEGFGRYAVALLKVDGIMTDTSDEVRLLHKFADNPLVRAIVLRIESPGGSVGAAQELFRELQKVRKRSRKPIVASMGNLGASGGYYVACGADEIFANPGSVTGSIGVIFQSYNLEGVSQKIGFGVNTIKSGKFKDTGSLFREMTAEEKQLLQGTIDDTYDQFLEAVLDGRRVPLARAYLRRLEGRTTATVAVAASATTEPLAEKKPALADAVPRATVKEYLRSFADGRVLSGHQANELGLVDNLGNLRDAIDRAAQLAGIRGKPYILQERRKASLWDLIQSGAGIVGRLAPRHGVALEYRLAFE